LDSGVQLDILKQCTYHFSIGKRGGVEKNDLYATIEYAEGGNTIQSRLVTNDPACIHQAFHLKNYGKTI
jgi:hypothetical protein